MPDRVSALKHLASAPAASAGTHLSEVPAGSILQLQAWPQTVGTVQRVVTDLLRVDTPQIGRATTAPGVTVAAVAPGRYLVAADAPGLAEKFEAALPSADGAVSDMSHGRVILRITGPSAVAVLTTSIALDLDPAMFTVGRVAQTMIHHVDVVLHRRGDAEFELWVLRGFAEALLEWLLDQGEPFGVAFSG
jgi:sarcosine oxidase subunit gamma